MCVSAMHLSILNKIKTNFFLILIKICQCKKQCWLIKNPNINKETSAKMETVFEQFCNDLARNCEESKDKKIVELLAACSIDEYLY